jgi:hypothetical protein
MIRIGNKSDILQQLETIYQQAGIKNQNYLKFCPNIAKIEKTNASKIPQTTPANTVSSTPSIEKRVEDKEKTVEDN